MSQRLEQTTLTFDNRSAALVSLKEICKIDTTYLVEQTIPALVTQLPESAEQQGAIGYNQLLAAIKSLCPTPALFASVVPLLLQKFDVVCKKGNFYGASKSFDKVSNERYQINIQVIHVQF